MNAADSPRNVKMFARGEIIAAEGSPAGGWYVLLSGRVAVFKQERHVAEFSTRGMVFGEISSILSRPRTATLVAVEPTTVLYFEAGLDELVTRYPTVAKTVLVSLAQRLERTTDALWVAMNQARVAEASAPAAAATPPATSDTIPPAG